MKEEMERAEEGSEVRMRRRKRRRERWKEEMWRGVRRRRRRRWKASEIGVIEMEGK